MMNGTVLSRLENKAAQRVQVIVYHFPPQLLGIPGTLQLN
jgi:hypothetical protein